MLFGPPSTDLENYLLGQFCKVNGQALIIKFKYYPSLSKGLVKADGAAYFVLEAVRTKIVNM